MYPHVNIDKCQSLINWKHIPATSVITHYHNYPTSETTYNSIIAGCISNGQEGEHRRLVKDFVETIKLSSAQYKECKELMVDFHREKHLIPLAAVSIMRA